MCSRKSSSLYMYACIYVWTMYFKIFVLVFVKFAGMTTNGLVLSEKLDSLIDAGLTSVNISLGM